MFECRGIKKSGTHRACRGSIRRGPILNEFKAFTASKSD